ncbi:MAG: class I tRNA ligase family protein, partial [Candidatus Pacebacteria bacterium]|nr:class I tRNA ligase family protein [Candidatus Paceibacterota bacterium]
NKLWNVARFVLSSADGERGKDQQKAKSIAFDPNFSKWSPADLMLKKELDDLITEITKEMDEYKFYLVSEKLYHYVWHTFADKILEDSKKALIGADSESRVQLLLLILQTVLKALHPFMPYITEEIWSDMSVKGKQQLLMISEWPTSK